VHQRSAGGGAARGVGSAGRGHSGGCATRAEEEEGRAPRRPVVSRSGADGLTRARRARILRCGRCREGLKVPATRGAGDRVRRARVGATEEEESPAEQRYG
jgi:hypothetical protein